MSQIVNFFGFLLENPVVFGLFVCLWLYGLLCFDRRCHREDHKRFWAKKEQRVLDKIWGEAK